METNKDLVLRLYERKDSKRRRMLFEHYQNLFESKYSARFLAEMINADLGAETVDNYDIKYVRSKSRKWQSESSSNENSSNIKLPVIPAEPAKPKNTKWSLAEPKPFINPSKKRKP